MVEIMVDLETLGRRAGCVVLSIGAVVFDENGLHQEFYTALPIGMQKKARLHVDRETEDWWSKQSAQARKVFDECATLPDAELYTCMDAWCDWLKSLGDKRSLALWGNGSDFDNAILIALHEAANRPAPWEFWNNRCYRTLKNLPGAKEVKVERAGTYHNALDDAKTQAKHAIRVMKHLKLWS